MNELIFCPKKSRHDGKAVAIYHTAGKGTRLAPLPGAENNNKPGDGGTMDGMKDMQR